MYIKQVIIQGFRSYRDETIFDSFSPRYNIIVGRNGCGKSNFFFAIQFVLSDEFNNLSAEGRYNLMHEGINSRALNAYVEIIFDNSDSRIMIDKPEVAVRRQISGKKDNYFLDRKVVNKTDIINMLEGAGFSRSNPYYIVKQGKITQMAIAPDANRLQLLREVAGTKVYDEKKHESEAILVETEERRKKIADLLKAIEERLISLETEKEELKQYQKWDRSKRGLECAICTKECEDAKRRIDEIVVKMNSSTKKNEQLETDRLTVTEMIQQTIDSITELKQRLQTQQIERETLIIDNKDNFQRKAQIELELQDFQSETSQRDTKRNQLRKELEKYDQLINESEQKLTKIIPEYNIIRRQEEQKTAQRDLAEEKRKELYAKRGRGNQFTSKEDRDKWIRIELKSLTKAIHDKREQMERLKKDLQDDTIKSHEIEEQLRQIVDNENEQRTHMDNVNIRVRDLRQKKSDIATQKTELARKETQLHIQISQTRDELRKYQDTLRSIINKGAALGTEGLQRLLRQFADENRNQDIINGYHGTLIENLECDPTFYTAVEVIAGNRKFSKPGESPSPTQLKNSNKDIDEHINEEKRNTDKYEVKLRNAQNKLDESAKRQNDIGVPPDGLDKYKDIPIKQLQHDLDRAIIELKKYAHVNKKALDQFLQFSDERDKLTNRKAEIDEAHRHIVDLIESLDNKRFETIQFTFKQVSLYFTEVFKRLVPEGTAHLVIKKGDNEDFDSEQVSLQSPGQQMSVDDFTGVGIKVSFNGRTNEMRDMQQLSGGQKSLVALALIFAIQKCDPAPFYLFDEIDQSLDPQYRNAVAMEGWTISPLHRETVPLLAEMV
ncbi:unnamed protein product [Rotaria sp. Silwood1]|nr:unnamed protein product [Rotaria sp. Silwood1]